MKKLPPPPVDPKIACPECGAKDTHGPHRDGCSGTLTIEPRPPAAEPPEPPAFDDGVERVIVRRYRDEFTLVGQPVLIRPLDEMVDALLVSDFVRPWLRERLASHLRAGHGFSLLGTAGAVKAEYRMCTLRDVQRLRQESGLAAAMAKGDVRCEEPEKKVKKDAAAAEEGASPSEPKAPKASRPPKAPSARSAAIVYHVPAAGKDDETKTKELQRQGKIILDLMREKVGPAGGDITAMELDMLLESKRAEIKTGQPVLRLFGFHMSQFYKKLGLVARKEEK